MIPVSRSGDRHRIDALDQRIASLGGPRPDLLGVEHRVLAVADHHCALVSDFETMVVAAVRNIRNVADEQPEVVAQLKAKIDKRFK